MRILFDITHPAKVHFFRNLIPRFKNEGHKVLVTSRDKDVTLQLLENFSIEHTCISRRGNHIFALGMELILRSWRLWNIARNFRPDVMVSADGGIAICPVGFLLRRPSLLFDQTDLAVLQRSIERMFVSHVCTGEGYRFDFGKRHSRFRGVLAQSYLDPDVFSPDPERLLAAGIDPTSRYSVIRLVQWSANHDIGRTGTSVDGLKKLISVLEAYGRVFISSEVALPEEFNQYLLRGLPANEFHNLLAFADLCVAEGGTVALEAALLGTPSIFYNTYEFGYLRALEEQYDLFRRAGTAEEVIDQSRNFLEDPIAREELRVKLQNYFNATDSVSDIMYGVIKQVGENGHSQ